MKAKYTLHTSFTVSRALIIYSFVCQIILGDISTTLDTIDCFLCSDIFVVSDQQGVSFSVFSLLNTSLTALNLSYLLCPPILLTHSEICSNLMLTEVFCPTRS